MNKHYVRLDGDVIVKGFSDAFEKPLETDILIGEGGRHFELDGEINPSLKDIDLCPLYKFVKDEIVNTDNVWRGLWKDLNKHESIQNVLTLEERVSKLEQTILNKEGARDGVYKEI